MATEILLTSEKFVKEVMSVSDNLAGKYILPSIREAQEQGLKGIVGSCLLRALKERVRDGSINAPDAEPYRELLSRARYYLAYTAIVEVSVKVSWKIANMGVTRTTDEGVSYASADEIDKMRYYYQAKADACAFELQGWLLDNARALPELDACACERIRANLTSAASCGIWLGGPYGKR